MEKTASPASASPVSAEAAAPTSPAAPPAPVPTPAVEAFKWGFLKLGVPNWGSP